MYRVLLVEDEDIIRRGLMFTVDWESVNCVVIGEARNGIEGLERIQNDHPDIVIVDVNMPDMDGLQMLEKSIEEFQYGAIIISGYNEFKYAKKGITLGISEYLLKPVNYHELYGAIRKIINKREKISRLKDEQRILNVEKQKMGIIDQTVKTKTGNKYVDKMLESVRKDYNKRIAITDISAECGMSCTYLNNKFKELTGYTFNDYLNRYRMQKAIEFMKMEKYKIYEVADMVGFSDYKYFIKVFKKYTGYSPTKILDNKDSSVSKDDN